MHAHRDLPIPRSGLKLAVVADTHSRPHPDAARLIRERNPDFILHAGDIGALTVLDDLEKLAPVHAIRGNIDPPAREIPETMTMDLVAGGRKLLTLVLTHIGVYGPKLRRDAIQLARREGASLLICGHSHVPFIGKDAGISVFNPGSVGPRRFGLPIVFGMLEIGSGRLQMHHVDCETGERWEPY
jgi:putative phosphoesterase